MSDYHTVVIGAGSAGLTVGVGLAGFGKRVALIEGGHVGGDCTNFGCIPSKTLLHLVHDEPDLSPEETLRRVQEKRNHLRDEETAWVKDIKNLTFLAGHATLRDAETVAVTLKEGGERLLKARNVVIAAGAEARIIPLPGLPETRTLTNESLFELEHPPRHLAIIGSGAVGIEMAFAFRRLGCRVSVVSRSSRVLSFAEPEASDVIEASLQERGVNLYLNTTPAAYDEKTETLRLEDGGVLEGVDKVLLAVGRVARLGGLGLESLGIVYDENGVETNAYGATDVKGVYVIGDANNNSQYTHSANKQGRRLVQKLALPFLPLLKPEPPYPSATFCEPELATAGLPLETLKARHGEAVKTYHIELSKTDRGYTMGLTRGFMRIHAMRLTGRVLGATVVAPNASELILLLNYAVTEGVTLYKLSSLVYPYPTLSEGIKKAASEFTLGTLPALPRELGVYLRERLRAVLR